MAGELPGGPIDPRMEKGWLRVMRVAKFLDCTKGHVYDLVRQGELEGLKGPNRGQGWRISQESLERFVERHRIKADEAGEP